MSFVCRLCRDRFHPGAEVCMTACGHFFHVSCLTWQESKSFCPQCKLLVKEKPFRAYPDFQDTTVDLEDVAALKLELGNLQRTYECEVRKYDKAQGTEATLMEKLDKEREMELLAKDTIKILTKRISDLNKKKIELEPFRTHNIKLEKQIDDMKDTQALMQNVEDKVQDMMKKTPTTPLAINHLCLYVETLKKQLINDDFKYKKEKKVVAQKIRNSLNELRKVENETAVWEIFNK